MTAFDMEAIEILAGTKKEDGESSVPDTPSDGDGILGLTKSFTYDRSWGADDDEE